MEFLSHLVEFLLVLGDGLASAESKRLLFLVVHHLADQGVFLMVRDTWRIIQL